MTYYRNEGGMRDENNTKYFLHGSNQLGYIIITVRLPSQPVFIGKNRYLVVSDVQNSGTISGSDVYYAGGGGGSVYPSGNVGGTGGIGGGGAGSAGAGINGTNGTGGGGGGAERNGTGLAGAGGSGIVIVRYVTAEFGTCTGGTKTTVGNDTIHAFTSDGTFTVGEAPTPTPTITPTPTPTKSMDSHGPPSAGSGLYSLSQIYDYVNSGTEATPVPSFQEPGAPPGPTMRTTKEIYDNIHGNLSQSGATAADVRSGVKFFSTQPGSWGVQTGTLVVP